MFLKLFLILLISDYVRSQTMGIIPSIILATIYNFLAGFSLTSNNIVQDENIVTKEYDFIIIGAGSAGSVLANRLTENLDWNVLILEAGEDEIFFTDIPIVAPVLHITDYVQSYKSEPSSQKQDGSGGYCFSMTEGRCKMISGKAVGGTSVVNFMVYSRGISADYDGWQALGNPGWGYKDILPYFIKSEKCRMNECDRRYHGYEGYLDVTNPPYATPLRECFLQAGKELGYDIIDYNSRPIGFSMVQANLRNGRRVSANKAFLRPIRGRNNFYLSKSSRVTKIVINPETKRAIGVQFIKNHKKYYVSATKEIILSAGALNSPRLLMLSGLGPRDHLNSLGIRLIEDLPVGFNLQDHVNTVLTFFINESIALIASRLISNPVNFIKYLIQETGPLTIPGGTEAVAFINTKSNNLKMIDRKMSEFKYFTESNTSKNIEQSVRKIANINSINVDHSILRTYPHIDMNKQLIQDDYPDIELILGASSLVGDVPEGFRGLLGLSKEFYNEVYSDYEHRDAFTIVPVLLRPKSRGRIMLRSSNPFDWPILDINYYDNEDDLNTMVQGIKKAIKIVSTRAFKRFNATLIPVPFPGCKHIAFNSDIYWACAARHMSTTLGHFAGTCKMGTRENSGVVDHRLRVHGINGLRVVDASIMPTIISGHTNAPTYMIADKASDMIKEDWKYFIL